MKTQDGQATILSPAPCASGEQATVNPPYVTGLPSCKPPGLSQWSLTSDIPYGINFNAWDVLHNNSNSGLLGQSPAQVGKPGFVRRGKPIQGWSAADRNIPNEYQDWCTRWATLTYPKLMPGASLFIFGARRTLHRAIVALEDAGFLLRDVLVGTSPTHSIDPVSNQIPANPLTLPPWEG